MKEGDNIRAVKSFEESNAPDWDLLFSKGDLAHVSSIGIRRGTHEVDDVDTTEIVFESGLMFSASTRLIEEYFVVTEENSNG